MNAFGTPTPIGDSLDANHNWLNGGQLGSHIIVSAVRLCLIRELAEQRHIVGCQIAVVGEFGNQRRRCEIAISGGCIVKRKPDGCQHQPANRSNEMVVTSSSKRRPFGKPSMWNRLNCGVRKCRICQSQHGGANQPHPGVICVFAVAAIRYRRCHIQPDTSPP